MSKKASTATPFLSNTLIIAIAIAWAVVSLLFFLLFGVPPASGEHPNWFFLGVNFFGMGAFAAAAILCFRNWKSSQIVSGRGVWLALGLGMLLYLMGDVALFVWEVILQQPPDISPADFFYVLSYISMAWGMFLAVLPRRLNMELHQWLIVVGIAVLGIAIASYFVLSALAEPEVESPTEPPAVEQTVPEATADPQASPPDAAPDAAAPDVTPAPEAEAADSAPDWAIALGDVLAPLFLPVNIFYQVADVLLLTLATTLLLAFWGGRFSYSWRMIAAAALSFYVADTSATFRITQGDVTPGNPLEVGWIFSALLFAIGATLEYGMSTRSRRGTGRRRA